jgi:hypothetical protein
MARIVELTNAYEFQPALCKSPDWATLALLPGNKSSFTCFPSSFRL